MASINTINLGTGRKVTQMAVGSLHVCALLDDQSVKCWEQGANGQLGQQMEQILGGYAGDLGDNLPGILIFP